MAKGFSMSVSRSFLAAAKRFETTGGAFTRANR
jgi:hypothetical protein